MCWRSIPNCERRETIQLKRGVSVKIIIFYLVVLTSFISIATNAQSQFIKYRGLVIPVSNSNTPNESREIVTASLLDSVAFSNRTTSGARVTGGLSNNASEINTWFVLRQGVTTNLAIDECSNLARRNERVINSSGGTNTLNTVGQSANTRFTVTFCAQRASSSSTVATEAISRVYQTLRDEDTLVEHNCNSPEVFRSADGPLNISVFDPDITDIRDSSQVVITNLSATNLNYRFTESLFGAQTVGIRTVPATSVRTDNVQPRLITSERVVRYGVRIFGGQNWTARFSCRNLFCSLIGNPTGTTSDIANGRCSGISPI